MSSHNDLFRTIQTRAVGPKGSLPLTHEMLRDWPSGHLFGLSQDAGMGWKPQELSRDEYLILSTQGGVRAEDGSPIALGYHTGHWEVGLLVKRAAETFTQQGATPFAAFCSDPCDGRSQGTTGMMDSLAYRNDAAVVLRRLARSLPRRKGVMGIATCDKGLPAMMMALAGLHHLPCAIVPGGVTLPPEDGEDAGKVQTIGARYAHGLISLKEAAEMGCRACATPGGGCQFFGTAATAQVVAEGLGLTLPHAALAPSGQPIWLKLAEDTALALMRMADQGITVRDLLTPSSIRNAMTVHAACGGSTNLLLHIPAIAHAAGLSRPTVEDWIAINRRTPRLVDVLPNGPSGHPTIRLYLAGGAPEVMLHLRELGLLDLDALTITGQSLGQNLEEWETSERRLAVRERLKRADGVDPDSVIYTPYRAKEAGLTSTVCFPVGNIAPEGSVIKATAIDASMVDDEGVYRHTGPARVFCSEPEAIEAIKSGGPEATHLRAVRPGDVLVLIGRGPSGAGMEETYQVTSALKHLPWGKQVAVVTDARFSGVSTGACIGHVGPEALAGGPIGKLRDGDLVELVVDRISLTGSLNMIGQEGHIKGVEWGAAELLKRQPHPDLRPDPDLPDDTRLWAALQATSGGTWGGCVYDVDEVVQRLKGE